MPFPGPEDPEPLPRRYRNLFPAMDAALKVEARQAARLAHPPPASAFPQMEGAATINLLQQLAGAPPRPLAPPAPPGPSCRTAT